MCVCVHARARARLSVCLCAVGGGGGGGSKRMRARADSNIWYDRQNPYDKRFQWLARYAGATRQTPDVLQAPAVAGAAWGWLCMGQAQGRPSLTLTARPLCRLHVSLGTPPSLCVIREGLND